ncbi:MAG TPA: S8 family serine peptidase [Candidatus Cybelea sp.]|nr:S8 family serine peptidase [Candidatus Cybelea sp.]
MNLFQPVRRGVVVIVSSAVLAGCGSTSLLGSAPQSSPSTAGSVPGWQSKGLARPACGKPGADEAQCFALILNSKVRPDVAGWTPADFQARYDLPSQTKGAGEIVAIVDAYDNPNVAGDLATYRSEFGLGTANFTKYNQKGEIGNYPDGSKGWGVEIDLDAQMVAASCPLCTVYLVEAKNNGTRNLAAAEDEAVKLGATIVSNSWGCGATVTCVSTKYFNKPGVLYLASTGDSGIGEVSAPAAFDNVAAIGGTVLAKNGSQYSESIWDGAGGGCATTIHKPKWQHDKVCSGRAVGDASAVAWQVAVYDSYGYGGWATIGGTSVSSPLMAGMFGLAGNVAKQKGGETFWKGKHHKELWDVCGSSCLFSSYSYEGGWGSPDGIGAL